MNVVFRFASRIIVMVGGRILVEGTPEEIAADARVREVYLGRRRTMAEPLLALDDVRAGYGDAVVLDGISLEVPEQRQPRGARPQRRRQVDAAAHHHGLHAVSRAARSSGAARTSPAAPPHRRARARPRLGGAGARDLSLADASRRTSPSRRAPGRWDLKAVYELFPAARRAARQHGQPALRRRAADAGDRARADDQSGAAAARRAARRPGADHRRGADRRDRPHDRRRRHRRHPDRAARRTRAVADAATPS